MDRARGSNTGRGRAIPATPHRVGSTGRGVIQAYAPGIRMNAGNLRGIGEPNTTMPHKPLLKREAINMNEDVAPKVLTFMFNQCTTFEELTNLYNGQKDKYYFNFKRAFNCFSQAVMQFTKLAGDENTTNSQAQLAVFVDKLFSYKELNAKALFNLANDALKLLNHTQEKSFQGAEMVERLALNTLCHVFQEIISKKNLQCFKSRILSHIANDAVKLLNYGKQKNSEGTEFVELALSTLSCIFQAFNSKNDLQHFHSQVLSDLANDAVVFLNYVQSHRRFSGAESIVWNVFRNISQEMNVRALILEG